MFDTSSPFRVIELIIPPPFVTIYDKTSMNSSQRFANEGFYLVVLLQNMSLSGSFDEAEQSPSMSNRFVPGKVTDRQQ